VTHGFWEGRKVLVTVADGFIGSHLTERLETLGAEVRAFCLYNSNGSWGWLDGADPAVKRLLDVRLGDILDARFLEESCKGADTVFHLAALIAIPYSYTAPESFVDTNVKRTLNILEAVRRAGCRTMIHTSTSELYGTAQRVPIEEAHPLKGQSPYSASKIGADKIAESFHLSFRLPVVTVRPFNTFGPRQSARAVIPTIITQLLAGQTVRLGNTSPTRDLSFVANTVDGFVLAASTPAAIGRTINLGSGREISISDLAQLIARLMDKPIHIESEYTRMRPGAVRWNDCWQTIGSRANCLVGNRV